MKRQIVYYGALPQDTDLLNTQKNSYIALAKLASAILGTNTIFHGLAATPGSGLNVSIAAGQVFSLQNVDNAVYGSIAADTSHQILKQGINLDATTLSVPAPATSGQSINYLVQAQFQEVDGGSQVLPYYNSANPTVALSGQNNNGQAQATYRDNIVALQVKAGAAAATGSQTTPAADSGWTGLYVVTVAYGATSISQSNISTVAGAPFLTEALGNKISTATGDLRYAALAGSASQVFSVANATQNSHAINQGQMNSTISGLNLKSMSQQDSTAVSIAGGAMDGVTIGGTTPSTGVFTSVTAKPGNAGNMFKTQSGNSNQTPYLEIKSAFNSKSSLYATNCLAFDNGAGYAFYSDATANLQTGSWGSTGVVVGKISPAGRLLWGTTTDNGADIGQFNGTVYATGYKSGATSFATPAAGNGLFGAHATWGAYIAGQGTSFDSMLANRSGTIGLGVYANSTRVGTNGVTDDGVSDFQSKVGKFSGTVTVANATASGHAVNLGQFASSTVSSGYQKLPNGLILQWGTDAPAAIASNTTNTKTITLPIAFPTACLWVGVTKDVNGTPASAAYGAADYMDGSMTANNFQLGYDNVASLSLTIGARWVAIGY